MIRIAASVRAARRWVVVPAALGALVLGACADPTAATPDAYAGADVAFARNARATSSIVVAVSGVATGAASVRVTGPGGYARTLTGSATLTSLANGTYTVAASTVTVSGVMYTPTPLTRSVSVSNGSVGRADVVYAANVTSGALRVSVTMPDATPAAITVTGPNAFSTLVTSTRTISSLSPGTYTVTSTSVTSSGGSSYTPTPATTTVAVTAGATASTTITYAAAPPPPPPPVSGMNLTIAGMYVTQSVQSMADSVPLVAGRDGVLRIFALANSANSLQPTVRARVYRNGALVATLTANAPSTSVPLSVDESVLTKSWNIALPGSLITGGLSILADVDPTNVIAEGSETDNSFPTSGTAKVFNVRAVPNFAVKFVPLYQDSTLKGNITTANTDAFLQRTRDIHPINTITSSVRAPYTTAFRLGSDGTNWSRVLSELRSVQIADGSSDTYYGVAKVTYGSGVAGIGYIGAPASMGWDYLPSGSEVMAHELGHNWGRQHAPCGGVAGADGAFPYTGGTIGTYGFNVRTNTLIQKSTSDLMGYCSPTWTSDYTYLGVLKFRGNSVAPMTMSVATQPGLLVWGHIAQDGTVELEPAIRLNARPSMPTKTGAYQVQGTDANGVPVFALSFDPEPIADETGRTESTFAFIVPLSDAAHDRLSSLTVRGKGRASEQTSRITPSALMQTAESASVDASGTGRARARWNASAAKMVVVRDASTGEILSFARGGDASLRTNSANVELIVSDGVHSVTRRTVVKPLR